ncbi:MAG: arginine--tRNA ligase [Candidatus Atribacteria bacterium]|nr:arginine--tRNA ligase [Candidatus Atribacteria bacterium]
MFDKANDDNLKQIISRAVTQYLENNKIELKAIPKIILTIPKNPAHGHLSTNIALQLSGLLEGNAKNIAQFIGREAEQNNPEIFEKIKIEGPGFINFYFRKDLFYGLLLEIISEKEKYGHSKRGNGEKVLVEYVSVNPTGPLHIGHGKCAVVGDSLSRILAAAGYQVATEYYINDHGKQIDLLGESVLARYRQLCGEEVVFPENGYQGDYIVTIAQEIKEKNQDKFKGKIDSGTKRFVRDYAKQRILADIREDLIAFGVKFDNWFSEESLYVQNRVQTVIEKLNQKGFIFSSKGALWFKSTDFGDEKDRVVTKENGEDTYFASDIAYHDDKYRRGFTTLIDIWGSDHHGYINRMKAAIQALGYAKDSFQVLLVQFVTLVRAGQIIGMSTRGGQFITLKDLLKEVGTDVARYFFLMNSHDSHTEFNLDIAKSQSLENPVFYIQYAYARICSIIEKGSARNIVLNDWNKDSIDLVLLDKKEELEIIKKLGQFKKIVERSAEQRKPYLIAGYLHELASLFHKYYTEYKVIGEDKKLSLARLYLISCIKIVLENSLSLLGIQAPEKM